MLFTLRYTWVSSLSGKSGPSVGCGSPSSATHNRKEYRTIKKGHRTSLPVRLWTIKNTSADFLPFLPGSPLSAPPQKPFQEFEIIPAVFRYGILLARITNIICSSSHYDLQVPLHVPPGKSSPIRSDEHFLLDTFSHSGPIANSLHISAFFCKYPTAPAEDLKLPLFGRFQHAAVETGHRFTWSLMWHLGNLLQWSTETLCDYFRNSAGDLLKQATKIPSKEKNAAGLLESRNETKEEKPKKKSDNLLEGGGGRKGMRMRRQKITFLEPPPPSHGKLCQDFPNLCRDHSYRTGGSGG